MNNFRILLMQVFVILTCWLIVITVYTRYGEKYGK